MDQDEEEEAYHIRGPMRRHPWRKMAPPQGGEQKDDRPVEGVIFIPHTQDSDLQRRLQKVDDKVTKALQMPRTKYVERAGVTLKDMLVRKNPWFQLGGELNVLCVNRRRRGRRKGTKERHST